jgi:hypothetical protein
MPTVRARRTRFAFLMYMHLDLSAREAKLIESVADEVMEAVVARMTPLLEPE